MLGPMDESEAEGKLGMRQTLTDDKLWRTGLERMAETQRRQWS